MKLPYLLACLPLLSGYAFSYEPPPGVEFIPDVVIREGNEAWKVDIARPIDRSVRLPAILDYHGGGWKFGDKDGRRGAICRFAEEGFIAIAVRYRLTGEAPFPACVDDSVMAMRWVRAHADEYGIDPARIGAYGHSAGAHLALMMGLAEPEGAFAPGYLEEFQGPANAVVALAPPTDFIHWGEDRGESRGPGALLQGPPEELEARKRRASPISYVSGEAPPVLLVHGSEDRTVPPIQSERLIEALEQAGAPLTLHVVYVGQPHDLMMTGEPLIWPQVIAFFRATLGSDPNYLVRSRELAETWRSMGRDEAARRAWYGQFDRDGDGRVSRNENAGTAELFDRIDRGAKGFVEVEHQ